MANTLLMPFINGSHEFVHGFEIGQLWEMIKECKAIQSRPVHKSNEDQIRLMCETMGCDYTLEPLDETWSTLTVLQISVESLI